MWARIADHDADLLLEQALQRGVSFVPGSAFAVEPDSGAHHDRLRLSFATLDHDQINEACSRLAAAAALVSDLAPVQ